MMTDKEALKMFVKVAAHLKEKGLLQDIWDFDISHVYDLIYMDKTLSDMMKRNNLSACETLQRIEKGGLQI
jgi:hypothetical protein